MCGFGFRGPSPIWENLGGAAQGFDPEPQVHQQIPPRSEPPAPIAPAHVPLNMLMLVFFRELPYEAAKAAYKRAAAMFHPDAGGSESKMKALNMAWQRIEKEFYGK